MDGSLDQFDCRIQLAGLSGDKAKQMQSMRVVWMLGQDLAVNDLGLGESSRLVVLDGAAHRFINRHLRHPRLLGSFQFSDPGATTTGENIAAPGTIKPVSYSDIPNWWIVTERSANKMGTANPGHFRDFFLAAAWLKISSG
jgi:hypothetical protein